MSLSSEGTGADAVHPLHQESLYPSRLLVERQAASSHYYPSPGEKTEFSPVLNSRRCIGRHTHFVLFLFYGLAVFIAAFIMYF